MNSNVPMGQGLLIDESEREHFLGSVLNKPGYQTKLGGGCN